MKQTKTVEQFFPKKVQKHHRLWPFMIFKVNNNKYLKEQSCGSDQLLYGVRAPP